MATTAFATSSALKSLFRTRLDQWQKRTHSTLEHLADLCGVTPSYLGHVSRYGRVPGKPVLILLALNLGLENPRELFEAAGLTGGWPFDSNMQLVPSDQRQQGFISLQVDMQGLSAAIAQVIRAEFKPRSLPQLTRGKALRAGLNTSQYFLCSSSAEGYAGAFPELLKLMMLSAQQRYELSAPAYPKALELLQSGELDLYGPIYSTPKRMGQAIFSMPFCKVPVAAVWRKRHCSALPPLPKPDSIHELMGRGYEVVVLSESASHDFALTVLGLPASRIISCASPIECIERLSLSAVAKPAHLMIVDAPIALNLQAKHPAELEAIFCSQQQPLGFFESSIAVRTDWPELQHFISETIRFFKGERTFHELVLRHVEASIQPLILL